MKCVIEKDGRFIHTQLCFRLGLWSSQAKNARAFSSIASAEEFAAENELADYEIVAYELLQHQEHGEKDLAEFIIYQAHSFILPCKTTGCYSLGRIPVKHERPTEKIKLQMAKKFIQQGWRFSDGPLCRECSQQKS